MLLRRKGLQQNRLRQRLQASAGESLQHAEEDERVEAGRHAAQQRGQGESGDADHQHAASAEAVRQPARHGQNDGVRHQVRRDHPRAFVDGGAQIARHVRHGDVHDRGVEDLHERGQHDCEWSRSRDSRAWRVSADISALPQL